MVEKKKKIFNLKNQNIILNTCNSYYSSFFGTTGAADKFIGRLETFETPDIWLA
jgi:hypothetical protein